MREPTESELKWSARLRAQQQESRAIEAEERYDRLRAAVVTVVDAEFGDDVPAIRQVLLDALDDECEVEFIRAMERVPRDSLKAEADT